MKRMMNEIGKRKVFVALCMLFLLPLCMFSNITSVKACEKSSNAPLVLKEEVTTTENETGDKTTEDTGFSIELDSDGNIVSSLDSNKDSKSSWNEIISKANDVLNGISAIVLIIILVAIFINLGGIALSSHNPARRSVFVTGALVCAIILAIFGAVWIFVKIAYNFFR